MRHLAIAPGREAEEAMVYGEAEQAVVCSLLIPDRRSGEQEEPGGEG